MLIAVAAVAISAMATGAVAGDGGRQFGVGLVLAGPVVSRAGDRYEYEAFAGLVRASRNLHIRAKAVAPSPTGPSELAPYDFLARRHYDVVVSLPFVPGLSHAARRFTNVKFVVLDGTRGELRAASKAAVAENVEGTVFHTEQAAYLAGFVAASMADLRPAPHVVSAVGGDPDEPQVQAFIAGFQAGAKRADPTIRVLKSYSYDFIDQAKCRHAALDQIAHGSEVVFDVAGDCGLGALEAAKQKGVYGVGVDSDQSALGGFILTSVVLNLNLAVYDLAKRLVRGRLPTGGNLSFDLRDRGVGLGRFSRKVPRSLRRELIPLAARIEEGKIVVPATLSPPR